MRVFLLLNYSRCLRLALVETLLGAHAAHCIEVAVTFMAFYPSRIFARLVAKIAASAGPVVVIAVVRKKELLDEVWGEV